MRGRLAAGWIRWDCAAALTALVITLGCPPSKVESAPDVSSEGGPAPAEAPARTDEPAPADASKAPPVPPADEVLARACTAHVPANRDTSRVRWDSLPDPEHWRSATRGYVAAVKQERVLPIGVAASNFADYIRRIHNRVHPRFVGYLEYSGPPTEEACTLSVLIEIVLDREGRIAALGVLEPSGAAEFDVSVLEILKRAEPYRPVSPHVLSRDERVYLHWRFFRAPAYACSTYYALPFLTSGG